jgi:hypothetical protein
VAHARQESGAGCHSGDGRGRRRGHGNVSHLRSCGDADTDERTVPDRQLWGTVLGVLGQG